jgi:hypothetical protein
MECEDHLHGSLDSWILNALLPVDCGGTLPNRHQIGESKWRGTAVASATDYAAHRMSVSLDFCALESEWGWLISSLACSFHPICMPVDALPMWVPTDAQIFHKSLMLGDKW